MTSIFASWTVGAALLFSAIKNMTLIQLVKGEPGPGQPASIVDTANAKAGSGATAGSGTTATTKANTHTESSEPLPGKGVKPKGKLTAKQLNGCPNDLHAPIEAVAATVLNRFTGLVITATSNGSHVSDSYHYKHRAVDIGGSPGEMLKAAAWIAKNLTHILTEGIHNPNLSVKYQKTVPSTYWGSETWAGHADHIHLAV